jgi:tetratricopeptide (TPR) repeat protein
MTKIEDDNLISLVGLQRTGTNYVDQVLRSALPDAPISFRRFWKHSFYEEVATIEFGESIIIVSRHPILWLQSCVLNSAKDIKEARAQFFSDGDDSALGFARLYNQFYQGWLAYKNEVGGYLIRYEDVVQGDASRSQSLFSRFKVANFSNVISTLPQSVQLNGEDLKAVIDRKCSLPVDLAKSFWSNIDPDMAAALEYTFEEIDFSPDYSGRQALRAAAYKLTENPDYLTDEEFELLVRDGKEKFSKDGLVLGQIGTSLFERADIETALSWLIDAIRAIEKNDDKIFGRVMDFRLVDYLELVSRTALEVRENKLKALVKYYGPKKRQIRPIYEAHNKYCLSICLSKLGLHDRAIASAEEAIRIGQTVPGGAAAWWFHHLGDLLARAGQRDRALESFRKADIAEPNNFRHKLRLASEYRARGDRHTSLRYIEKSLELQPNNGDVIGFYVTLLREIDPTNKQVLVHARRWVERRPMDSAARFCLSDELHRAGQLASAVEQARTAAALRPGTAWYHHHLAHLLMLSARYAEAAKAIAESIELEPRRATHHYIRGEVMLKLGDSAGAREALRIATECDDAIPWHFHLLGHVCALSGETSEAMSALQKAADMEPGNEVHRTELERLRGLRVEAG